MTISFSKLLAVCLLAAPALAGAASVIEVSNVSKSSFSHASGIELQYVDKAARPQDDFARHVNGVWIDTTEIPADKSSWGSFENLYEDTQPKLRKIV